MARLRHWCLIWAALCGIALFPLQAQAAFEYVTCTPEGGVANGEFFPADAGQGACQWSGIEHIFSQVICNFVTILNEVMAKTYCGMQHTLAQILALVIGLYIMIFGVQILIGLTQLNAREIVVRLLKIGGVWTFVTQSTWGVNYAFHFFISAATMGINWALRAIPNVDDASAICHFSDTGGVMPIYSYIDCLIYQAVIGPFTQANSELVFFFALMSYIIPPLFMMAIYWLLTTLGILVRTLVSFMMGIAAITFLIALAPVFLSLMLFNTTYQFFESWLKYMISYTLQIIITFSCVAMWVYTMTFFVGFFDELADVIFQYKSYHVVSAQTVSTQDTLSICPYRYQTDASGTPHVACAEALDPNPETNPLGWRQDQNKMIVISNIDQKYDELSAPQQTALNKLSYFVIFHLITLIIICYAFDALMKQSPVIARQLSGPQYTPILGQGFGMSGFGAVGKGAGSPQYQRDGGSGGDKPGWLSGDLASRGRGAITDLLSQTRNLITKR